MIDSWWIKSSEHEKLIWLAGLFDGEGSAGIYKIRNRNGLRVQMQCTMCDIGPIERLQEVFGGYILKKKRGKTNILQPYMWISTGSNSVRAAKRLLPYSMIKKEILIKISEYKAPKNQNDPYYKIYKKKYEQYFK